MDEQWKERFTSVYEELGGLGERVLGNQLVFLLLCPGG